MSAYGASSAAPDVQEREETGTGGSWELCVLETRLSERVHGAETDHIIFPTRSLEAFR